MINMKKGRMTSPSPPLNSPLRKVVPYVMTQILTPNKAIYMYFLYSKVYSNYITLYRQKNQ